MKVLVNGGLNLSVLDGWWAEAYEPGVGWAIGAATAGSDAADAAALFALLEEQIVPKFYERDPAGLPRRWLETVRASLSRLTPRFSSNRMVHEYLTRLYAPAERALDERIAERGAGARALERWSRDLAARWPGIRFGRLESTEAGQDRRFTVEVFLDDVSLDDVAVELYADPSAAGTRPERLRMTEAGALPGTTRGHLFSVMAPSRRSPECYTPRVVPASAAAILPLELPLVAWRS
jgi:starch phosphorylase